MKEFFTWIVVFITCISILPMLKVCKAHGSEQFELVDIDEGAKFKKKYPFLKARLLRLIKDDHIKTELCIKDTDKKTKTCTELRLKEVK